LFTLPGRIPQKPVSTIPFSLLWGKEGKHVVIISVISGNVQHKPGMSWTSGLMCAVHHKGHLFIMHL
jgi:hypothetical protein